MTRSRWQRESCFTWALSVGQGGTNVSFSYSWWSLWNVFPSSSLSCLVLSRTTSENRELSACVLILQRSEGKCVVLSFSFGLRASLLPFVSTASPLQCLEFHPHKSLFAVASVEGKVRYLWTAGNVFWLRTARNVFLVLIVYTVDDILNNDDMCDLNSFFFCYCTTRRMRWNCWSIRSTMYLSEMHSTCMHKHMLLLNFACEDNSNTGASDSHRCAARRDGQAPKLFPWSSNDTKKKRMTVKALLIKEGFLIPSAKAVAYCARLVYVRSRGRDS